MSDLFEHAAATAAKKEGMARVEQNSDERWKATMLEMVRLTCVEQLYFTSDDISERFEALPAPRPVTHDKRAFGPVMTAAAKNGWCEKTNTVRESSRTKLHASPRAIWRSKLYAKG